jgi:hypothetical protein
MLRAFSFLKEGLCGTEFSGFSSLLLHLKKIISGVWILLYTLGFNRIAYQDVEERPDLVPRVTLVGHGWKMVGVVVGSS